MLKMPEMVMFCDYDLKISSADNMPGKGIPGRG